MNLRKYLFNNALLVIACLFVMLSCDVQKRKYTKGFYFDRNSTKPIVKNDLENELSISNRKYYASKTEKIDILALEDESIVNEKINASCDTIILNNGVKMFVKVLSVGDEKIIYKNCESTSDETHILESAKVISIHYADGNKISLNKNLPEVSPNNDTKKIRTFKEYKNNEAERGSKQLDNAVAWLAAGLIFSPAIIIGLILAALARKKLKDKDGYEQRYRLANTLTIIGAVILGITLLIMVLILILMGI